MLLLGHAGPGINVYIALNPLALFINPSGFPSALSRIALRVRGKPVGCCVATLSPAHCIYSAVAGALSSKT